MSRKIGVPIKFLGAGASLAIPTGDGIRLLLSGNGLAANCLSLLFDHNGGTRVAVTCTRTLCRNGRLNAAGSCSFPTGKGHSRMRNGEFVKCRSGIVTSKNRKHSFAAL